MRETIAIRCSESKTHEKILNLHNKFAFLCLEFKLRV